ncbi:dihydrolipoamide acetyltransferase family protein [Actinomycetota bacterium Odt1-20B]
MGEFRMPALGADMTEGTLTEWLVSPGDPVTKGDVVAVIETSKSDIEVECFETGTLVRQLAKPGDVVPVGTPLALIESVAPEPVAPKSVAPEPVAPEPVAPGPVPRPKERVVPTGRASAGAGAGASAGSGAKGRAGRAGKPSAIPGTGPLVRHLATERAVDLAAVHGTGRGGRITRADVEHAASPRTSRVRATPFARRLADELHVDLAVLSGTGENGAVRAADVREAAAGTAPAPHPTAVRPSASPAATAAQPPPASATARQQAAMRRAIAELMSRSKREIPHYYLTTTIDLSAATVWLRRHNRDHPAGERLVPAALLLRATALAARRVPELNGFWQDGGFVPGRGVQLGVAVSLRSGGLLTPVLHDADALKPHELMDRLKDLVERARRGRLRAGEVAGATVTVSNLGDQGVESVYGVIHPPQVALVGFGAVRERPWATDGMLGVRPLVTATLSGDHRATDAATGARFLSVVDRLLQQPDELRS